MNAILLAVLLAQARAPEILERHCLKCHDARTHKGDLDLSTREAIKAKPETIWRSVAHLDEPHMPHKAPKLRDADLAELKAWIDGGMVIARPLKATESPEKHWAFAPLRRGSLDALSKGRPVEGRVLIRRVTYDLTGLPPAPEDLDRGYEETVDRLLASPAYGERWARHWLDVARYADSAGYETDADRKAIYQYRDAVIRALNQDLPFDAFVRWQLAGDQLAPDDPIALALTGFLTCGPASDTTPTDSRRNKEKYRMDELDDLVSTTGQAFLGLTVGCARCHDHKFDAISSREYYQLVAAFISTTPVEKPLLPAPRRLYDFVEPRRAALREARLRALPVSEDQKEILRLPLSPNNGTSSALYKKHGDALKVSDEQLRGTLTEEDRSRWDDLAGAAGGASPKAFVIAEGEPRKAWVLARGDVDLKTDEAPPGFLRVLERKAARDLRPRVALGEWLTDVEDGAGRLLARVIVNRLWMHHFGEGIVTTPNDFGLQGERPGDPELLDGLARELIEGGWKLKPLHRKILLSAAYRSARRPQRLEAETLRDAILAVSGRLNPEMFGPAVRVRIPGEAILSRTKDPYPANLQEGPASWRRSVYVFAKRSVMVPFFEVNDAPGSNASCGRRSRTTVAPQALTLLNDPFVRESARAFAQRAGNLERAFLLALGRAPTPAERELSRNLDLADFCHVLLTLNEFVYVD